MTDNTDTLAALSDQDFAQLGQDWFTEFHRRLAAAGFDTRHRERGFIAHEHVSRIARQAVDAGAIQPLSGGTDTPDRD